MPTRVLHLRSSAGFYGAERVIVTLMQRSPDVGVDTTLACIENYISGDQSLLEHAQQAKLNALEVPCKSRMDFHTVSKLVSICKQNQINIIHSHDYKSHFYGSVAARMSGCHQVATLHGKTFGDVKNRIYEVVENLLLRLVTHVTVVSEQLYVDLSKTRLKKKLSLIANGIDEKSFNPDIKGFGKSYWGFNGSDFVFGTIARLSEEKGHRVLLEAFAKLVINNDNENARLLLVGDGPLYEDVKILIKELDLINKVKLAGSQTEIQRILNDIDCYVSPSHTEGMPMSILEAMSSALPVVATDVGAVGYLLRDDYGKIVSAGDVEGLAQQMQLVLEDKGNLKSLGEKCRLRIEAEFSAGIQSREYANIYDAILYKNNS